MLPRLLLLTLAAPFTPLLESPPDEGWTRGEYFGTGEFADDAGIEAASVRLELRRDDAGYGTFDETRPYARSFYTTLTLPQEGARWCWRVQHLNLAGERSLPSAERCFRNDTTAPTSPAFVDAGAVVSDGLVFIDTQPATDALSGVASYVLDLAPAPGDDFYFFPDPEQALPLVAWVGEGSWVGWVRVYDLAGNDNQADFTRYRIPITITASTTPPTPAPPVFENTMVNAYGDALLWDGGFPAGVTHVVASFCNLDAGCQWRHGFHSAPVNDNPRRWLQVGDEGTFVARIAVVQGGQVGQWSAPSAPVLVDRTAPPVPPAFASNPRAVRAGPLQLSWGGVVDNLTGLRLTAIEETDLGSGAQRRLEAPAPAVSLGVTPPADGRFQYRAASVDRVGNQSDWTSPVVSILDSRGPRSLAPMARAQALDGGALVSITWALPADELSGVMSEDLLEVSVDGGSQVISVTGLAASRLVRAGRWQWSLRATDALGNVGDFSLPSNLVVVTEAGVSIGPSIATTALQARCEEPLAVHLEGSGDAPLTWSLLSGPAGMTVDSGGRLTWTPPPGTSGQEVVRVKLFNDVGLVTRDLALQVSCDAAPDAGAPATPKQLGVGCGCGALDGSLALLALALIARTARRRR